MTRRLHSRAAVVLALVIVLALAASLGQPGRVRAAPPRQAADNRLLLFEVTTGTLDEDTPEASYTVRARADTLISVTAWTLAGDLEIELTLSDSQGQPLAEGEVVEGPPFISVVEAFTVPAPDTYTMTVRRSGTTSGDYGLTVKPGYGGLDVWDDFQTLDNSFALQWSPTHTDLIDQEVVDGELKLSVRRDNFVGFGRPDYNLTWDDMYVEAQMRVEGTPSYWEYGFVVHLNETDSGSNYYLISVNSKQDWAMWSYYNHEWTNFSNWHSSSAIGDGSEPVLLGLFVQGNHFKLFADDVLLGEASDPNNLMPTGMFAFGASTTEKQKDLPITIYYDNLGITSPLVVSEQGSATPETQDNTGAETPTPAIGLTMPEKTPQAPPAEKTPSIGLTMPEKTPQAPPAEKTPSIGLTMPEKTPQAPPAEKTPSIGLTMPEKTPQAPPAEKTPGAPSIGLTMPDKTPQAPAEKTPEPQQSSGITLPNWTSGDPGVIMADLRDLMLVPDGGTLTITIPTSFGDASSAGFSYYPLGRGRVFRNFVLSFDAHLDITGPGSACGMHFRNSGAARYSAMISEDGSAMLAQFTADGAHPSSVYEAFGAVQKGQGKVNRVVVIALEDTVGMFVNGQLFAVGKFTADSGTLALEVYVNSDDAGRTQRTYCQVDNIWVWEF